MPGTLTVVKYKGEGDMHPGTIYYGNIRKVQSDNFLPFFWGDIHTYM